MGKPRQGGVRKAGPQDVHLQPSPTHPHAGADKPWVCPAARVGAATDLRSLLSGCDIGMSVGRVRH